MLAKVRRWGNSLAVRIPGETARRLRISEGDVVALELTGGAGDGGGVDLGTLPTFRDEDPEASIHHDQYLYRARRKGGRH